MRIDNRKVALIGTGLVGMSFAYALLNQNAADELVLIDLDRRRAEGEAMDLNHGLAFSNSHMRIYAGDYNDCAGADIVAICAGAAQKPGESRVDLLRRNAEVFRSIIGPVLQSGFSGIFLIATNPVDIMARQVQILSGFEPGRVLGTGTTLDTARLRYMLGSYFSVDPRNVHAYVIGEHGDSEFVPWSQALIATKQVLAICEESQGKYTQVRLDEIERDVREAGGRIIAAKNATNYGIGMAMVRIARAIFGDENSILTVSTMLRGEYGQTDVYAGAPCIVNRQGVTRTLSLRLTDSELGRMEASCSFLRDTFQNINGKQAG